MGEWEWEAWEWEAWEAMEEDGIPALVEDIDRFFCCMFGTHE